jgi:hypothetical protein
MADQPDTTSNYDAAMELYEDDPKSSSKGYGSKASKMRLIEDAKRLRDAASWDKRWSEFIAIYSNKYPYAELSEYDDVVVPNMVFSTVNVIVPSVAINSPKITVTANQFEDQDAAELVEAVVNHQWRAYDVQDQVRAAVKDFVIVGHGWVKVAWETHEEEVDLTEEELAMNIQQVLMEKSQVLAADPRNADLFPDDQELIDAVPTKELRITKDQPVAKRVSPFDIFTDPDAKVVEDLRWIAQRYYMPLEEARENEDWNEKVRTRLVRTRKSTARDNVEVEDSSTQSDGSGFAEIWEFYDLVENKMCVFSQGVEGHLVDPVDSPFINGHPFVFIPNYEVPERFFPVGDVETIFPLQLELGIARTAQINDRKRGRRITLFRENALGNQGVEDLRAGKDNVMIPVIKQDATFDEVFKQVSSLGLQPEWYRADQQAMEDINSVSGISEYIRGGTADIRRTATEVGVMQDAANARSADKLFKVEQAMSRIAERMIRLSQKFMEIEAVARVVTDNMVTDWRPYDRMALQGDFTFQVTAGSSQPLNESFRRQQAMQMMDTFGQFIGSGLLNDQEFLSEIMRLNGWGDPERFLGPGLPPPMPPEGSMPPDGSMPPEGAMPAMGGPLPGGPPMGMMPGM